MSKVEPVLSVHSSTSLFQFFLSACLIVCRSSFGSFLNLLSLSHSFSYHYIHFLSYVLFVALLSRTQFLQISKSIASFAIRRRMILRGNLWYEFHLVKTSLYIAHVVAELYM